MEYLEKEFDVSFLLIVIRATTNGWMTSVEYSTWLLQVYNKEDHRRLLIVDSYKPHQADSSVWIAKERCNADVVIILGGCVPLLLNQWTNASTSHSKNTWELAGRIGCDRHEPKPRLETSSSRQDKTQLTGCLKHGLQFAVLVCGISTALDGSEDDLVSDDLPDVDASDVEPDEDDSGDEDLSDVDPSLMTPMMACKLWYLSSYFTHTFIHYHYQCTIVHSMLTEHWHACLSSL